MHVELNSNLNKKTEKKVILILVLIFIMVSALYGIIESYMSLIKYYSITRLKENPIETIRLFFQEQLFIGPTLAVISLIGISLRTRVGWVLLAIYPIAKISRVVSLYSLEKLLFSKSYVVILWFVILLCLYRKSILEDYFSIIAKKRNLKIFILPIIIGVSITILLNQI
jgi:hypothetical protein